MSHLFAVDDGSVGLVRGQDEYLGYLYMLGS